MLYLNYEDESILVEVQKLLDAFEVTAEEATLIEKYNKLVAESQEYSTKRRTVAKKFVQDRRKVDKTYAHTRKKKEN